MNKKLNGFNNGRDTTDGIGGKPAYGEINKSKVMTKEEILLKHTRELFALNCTLYESKVDILEAMEEYSSQQNKELKEENERLKEHLDNTNPWKE